MDDNMMRIGKRYLELREQGSKGEAIYNQIRQEFPREAAHITDSTIRSYASTYKKSSDSESSDHKPLHRSEPTERSDHKPPSKSTESRKEEMKAIARAVFEDMIQNEKIVPNVPMETPEPPSLETIKSIAREVIHEMMSNEKIVPNVPIIHSTPSTEEMPPEPITLKTGKGGKPGRRQDRNNQKATVTIDQNLWALFDAEAKERKVTASRLIDVILWNRYGKPQLSYQAERQTSLLPETSESHEHEE